MEAKQNGWRKDVIGTFSGRLSVDIESNSKYFEKSLILRNTKIDRV